MKDFETYVEMYKQGIIPKVETVGHLLDAAAGTDPNELVNVLPVELAGLFWNDVNSYVKEEMVRIDSGPEPPGFPEAMVRLQKWYKENIEAQE